MEALLSGEEKGCQDLRDYMGWSDQIDVVRSLDLQGEHHPRKVLLPNRIAFSQVTDRIVLAKQAPQVASGEENSPRAISAHQGRLLAEVGAVAGYLSFGSDFTISEPIAEPIYLAFSRTEDALLKDFLRFICSPLEGVECNFHL
jgi:hypothetical protein